MFSCDIGSGWKAVRVLTGCLCTMLLGGPMLVVIGIYLYTMENSHAISFKNFNDAVDQFDETVAQQWLPASISIPTIGHKPFRHVTRSITITGHAEDFKKGISSVISASFANTVEPLANYEIDFNLSHADFFTASPKAYRADSETLACSRTDQQSSCTETEMEDECRRTHGDAATYEHMADGSCDLKRVCGVCRFNVYLSDFCVVVTGSGPFIKDIKRHSCYYPFSAMSNKYKNVNSGDTVDVTVMHSSDPFLVAQRITEGKMSFLAPVEQQRKVGLGLIATGAVFLVASAALCLYMFKVMRDGTSSVSEKQHLISEQYHQVTTQK